MFIAMTLRTIDALVVSSLFVSNRPRPNLRFARLNLRSTSILSVLSLYAAFFSALLSASFFGLPSFLPEIRIPRLLQKEMFSRLRYYLINKNSLGIMSCALLIVFDRSLQYCAFVVGIEGQLLDPAHPGLIN